MNQENVKTILVLKEMSLSEHKIGSNLVYTKISLVTWKTTMLKMLKMLKI